MIARFAFAETPNYNSYVCGSIWILGDYLLDFTHKVTSSDSWHRGLIHGIGWPRSNSMPHAGLELAIFLPQLLSAIISGFSSLFSGQSISQHLVCCVPEHHLLLPGRSAEMDIGPQ